MTGSKYHSFIESSSIHGANAPYIEAYYEQFLENPESVDESWRAYFRLIQDQNAPREQAHSQVIAHLYNQFNHIIHLPYFFQCF